MSILIHFMARGSITNVVAYMSTFIQQFSIIVHLPYAYCKFPVPVSMFYQFLLPFVMFDLTDLLETFSDYFSVEKLLGLEDEKANLKIRSNIAELGYQSNNCIVSLGFLWIVSTLFFIRFIIFGIIWLIS